MDERELGPRSVEGELEHAVDQLDAERDRSQEKGVVQRAAAEQEQANHGRDQGEQLIGRRRDPAVILQG